MVSRKILVSLMVVGIVGAAAAGTGTLALFSDQETSENNVIAAGSVDLKIDWQESTSPGVPQDTVADQPPTDDPGPIFDFGDLKPGDYGEATISLDLQTNPAWIWFKLQKTDDTDGSNPECTEPENEAEPDCGTDGDGELDDHFNYVLWYDDGDNEFEEDEEQIVKPGEVCRADVGLALDNSGSMYYTTFGGAEEEFEAEKDAAQKFVTDSFAGTGGSSSPKIGAVRFGGSAPETDTWPPVSQLHPMSTDESSINTAIGGLRPVGDFAEGISSSDYPSKYEGTDLAGGIEEAGDLVAADGRPNVEEDYIVVFSDGEQAVIQGDPAQAARDAENDHGVTVIAIAFAKQEDSNAASLNQTMKDVATGSGDSNFYFVDKGDYEELPDVFGDISDQICSEVTAEQILDEGIRLDGDQSQEGVQSFQDGTSHIGFKWNISEDAGNEAQTDSLVYDMSFFAEQARNNPDPESPFPIG